ncbi:MAG: hypothetical protein Q4A62_03315 [Eikenella sp.]|nr:hypothetical protein [Eikenella sp.]
MAILHAPLMLPDSRLPERKNHHALSPRHPAYCLLPTTVCRDDFHPEGLQHGLSIWQSKADELPIGAMEEAIRIW